jgi:hypothetical protein
MFQVKLFGVFEKGSLLVFSDKISVILPFLCIVNDIIADALPGFIVADDVIVVSGLPGEPGVDFAGVVGNPDFIATDDRCQIL